MMITPSQNPVDKATIIKHKIIEFLSKNGPSLPIPIAKEANISSLYSSAFLSEMIEEGTVRISKLKIGGSPLYFLPNHEVMLENFTRFLNPKEKEALAMLKERQVLKDAEQEPAIRLALRGIKDFAFPIIVDNNNEKLVYWRYMTLKESEATAKILPSIEKIKESPAPQPISIPEPKISISSPQPVFIQEPKIEIKSEIDAVKSIKKDAKESPAPKEAEKEVKNEVKHTDFSRKIEENLIESGLEIKERIEAKKKDYIAKVIVVSQVGKTPYLCIAKDKKKLTDNDFALAVQKAQSLKLPVLFISQGDLSEKAKAYLKLWEGLIKFSKIA